MAGDMDPYHVNLSHPIVYFSSKEQPALDVITYARGGGTSCSVWRRGGLATDTICECSMWYSSYLMARYGGLIFNYARMCKDLFIIVQIFPNL